MDMGEGVALRNMHITPDVPGRFTVTLTLDVATETSLDVATWALALLEA